MKYFAPRIKREGTALKQCKKHAMFLYTKKCMNLLFVQQIPSLIK